MSESADALGRLLRRAAGKSRGRGRGSFRGRRNVRGNGEEKKEEVNQAMDIVKRCCSRTSDQLRKADIMEVFNYAKRGGTNVSQVFSATMLVLEANNSNKRYLAALLCKLLVARSEEFRTLLLSDLQQFVYCTIGSNAACILPEPEAMADKLRNMSLGLLAAWKSEYGTKYAQLATVERFLRRKFRLRLPSLEDARSAQRPSTRRAERLAHELEVAVDQYTALEQAYTSFAAGLRSGLQAMLHNLSALEADDPFDAISTQATNAQWNEADEEADAIVRKIMRRERFAQGCIDDDDHPDDDCDASTVDRHADVNSPPSPAQADMEPVDSSRERVDEFTARRSLQRLFGMLVEEWEPQLAEKKDIIDRACDLLADHAEIDADRMRSIATDVEQLSGLVQKYKEHCLRYNINVHDDDSSSDDDFDNVLTVHKDSPATTSRTAALAASSTAHPPSSSATVSTHAPLHTVDEPRSPSPTEPVGENGDNDSSSESLENVPVHSSELSAEQRQQLLSSASAADHEEVRRMVLLGHLSEHVPVANAGVPRMHRFYGEADVDTSAAMRVDDLPGLCQYAFRRTSYVIPKAQAQSRRRQRSRTAAAAVPEPCGALLRSGKRCNWRSEDGKCPFHGPKDADADADAGAADAERSSHE